MSLPGSGGAFRRQDLVEGNDVTGIRPEGTPPPGGPDPSSLLLPSHRELMTLPRRVLSTMMFYFTTSPEDRAK